MRGVLCDPLEILSILKWRHSELKRRLLQRNRNVSKYTGSIFRGTITCWWKKVHLFSKTEKESFCSIMESKLCKVSFLLYNIRRWYTVAGKQLHSQKFIQMCLTKPLKASRGRRKKKKEKRDFFSLGNCFVTKFGGVLGGANSQDLYQGFEQCGTMSIQDLVLSSDFFVFLYQDCQE